MENSGGLLIANKDVLRKNEDIYENEGSEKMLHAFRKRRIRFLSWSRNENGSWQAESKFLTMFTRMKNSGAKVLRSAGTKWRSQKN